jgi:hypothetical protein
LLKHQKITLKGCSYLHYVILEKKRLREQWNQIENSEMDPCKYPKIIFDRKVNAKTIQWRKDSLFSADGVNNWACMSKNKQTNLRI